MITENFTGLEEQIRESREAGRISAEEEKAIRHMIDRYGNEYGLRTLQHFERTNYIREYVECRGSAFKMREFYYHCNMPEPVKEKIALALKEALSIMEADRRLLELRGGVGQ
jgi:hypothetical protein